MAKIVDTNLYDIADLITMWKSGWRNLSKLDCAIKNAHNIGFACWHDVPSERAYNGFMEIIQCFNVSPLRFESYTFADMLLIFVAGKKDSFEKDFNSYSYGVPQATRKRYLPLGYGREPSKKEQAMMCKIINRAIKAFTTSLDFGELLAKISNKANQKVFIEYWCNHPSWKYHSQQWSTDKFVSYRIEPGVKKAMQYLRDALNNIISFEEAWWKCIWLVSEPTINEMLKIRERIDADIPLGDEQIQLLNDYVNQGSPCIRILSDDNKKAVKVMLDVRNLETGEMYLRQMANALLTQPAFVLAQELQQKCMEPRFVAQCRAPSCGKRFYTGRKNATACPSKSSDGKSACALEWVRYKRYLQKINENPEKNWDNPKLKKQFISYDNS